MPDRARTICRNPGCGKVVNGPYCEAHTLNNSRLSYERDVRANDAVRRMYNNRGWRNFKSYVLVRNPQCQRIVNGVRCLHTSQVVHHLISPRVDPSLFLDPKNVVCVCNAHHPAGVAGTPEWRVGVDYVPTES